jgi:nucleotide-binding universal stress UspA family protein
MLPIKKILCPTDFSEPSYEAIKIAGELAFHFESELCLLHVVPPVPVIPMGEGPSAFDVSLYEQELETTSKRTLSEITNHLEWKELRGRLIVLRGNAADEIVRTAHEENVDLIVIATRGRTGLDRLLFGSVAEKVVRLARCPVLTVAGGPSREAQEETPREKGEIVDMPEETSEKRNAYVDRVEAELREWGVQLDVFKAKAEKSKAEVKMKYLEQVQELKKKQEVARQKLNELRESGDEAWGDFKKGVEEALGEMKKALKQAASRFKKP